MRLASANARMLRAHAERCMSTHSSVCERGPYALKRAATLPKLASCVGTPKLMCARKHWRENALRFFFLDISNALPNAPNTLPNAKYETKQNLKKSKRKRKGFFQTNGLPPIKRFFNVTSLTKHPSRRVMKIKRGFVFVNATTKVMLKPLTVHFEFPLVF